MKTNSSELNNLVWKKHELIRRLDRNKISIEDYNNQMIDIEKQIKEEQTRFLDSSLHKLNQNKNKLEEETKMEEQEKKIKSASRENSNAQLILEALQLKTIKNYKEVAAKVKEKKPEVDVKQIASQAKVMVREIIAGKGTKSKVYQWDAENFLLIKKV